MRALNLEMNLSQERLNSLVVESPEHLDQLILDIYESVNKKSEGIEYYVNNEKRNISDCFDMIVSPLDMTLNTREIQRKMILALVNDIKDSHAWSNISRIYGELIEEISDIEGQSMYNIDFSEEVDIQNIIKLAKMEIEEPEGSFIERFLEYGKVIHHLLGKCVFVLANCHSYLREKDYQYIEEWARYQDVCVLLLNHEQKRLNVALNECIIDIDLCEIH